MVAVNWKGAVVATSRLRADLPRRLNMSRLPAHIREKWWGPRLADPLHGNSVQAQGPRGVVANFKYINAFCHLELRGTRTLAVTWCRQMPARWTGPPTPAGHARSLPLGSFETPCYHGLHYYAHARRERHVATVFQNPFGAVAYRSGAGGVTARHAHYVAGWQAYGGAFALLSETSGLVVHGQRPPKGSHHVHTVAYVVSPVPVFAAQGPRFRTAHAATAPVSAYTATVFLPDPALHFRRVLACGGRACALSVQAVACLLRPSPHAALVVARRANGAELQRDTVTLRPHFLDTAVTLRYCECPAVLRLEVEDGCAAERPVPVPDRRVDERCREMVGTWEYRLKGWGDSSAFSGPRPRLPQCENASEPAPAGPPR